MDCLTEETIVAFVGARLSPDSVERVEAHAASCDACRELLYFALRAAPAPSVAAPATPESLESPAAPPDAATLERGTSFGRYSVLGPLGPGAMGEVCAAYDPELDRKVALKILPADPLPG
jgi:hypothetical protein